MLSSEPIIYYRPVNIQYLVVNDIQSQ